MPHTPSLEAARELRGAGTLLPIYRECLADTETPVSAYVKLRTDGPSFLLESVEGGERQGRYSIVAVAPSESVRFTADTAEHHLPDRVQRVPCADPLAFVDDVMRDRVAAPVEGLPRFQGGAIGYLGYDLIRAYEDIGPAGPAPYELPLAHLAFCDSLVVFDHLKHTIKVVAHARLDGDLESEYRAAAARIDELVDRLRLAPALDERYGVVADVPAILAPAPIPESNMPREQYEDMVRTAKEYITAGDIFQVVLAQRFSVPTDASALQIYRALRLVNPSPYMYLLDFGDHQLIGSSPELLVLVDGDLVSVHPIAGSRPRGATPEEDARLQAELLASEKERAEHVMLVDLGRNDVGRVSVPGTVAVDDLMSIERYSHIMHIVSNVTGRLRPDLRPMEALRACFPAGTVSGAPKIRAMQIISALEPEGRGAYAGAIGYFGYNGTVETAITIRTAVLKDGVAHVKAGCGIVADSDPAQEYQESVFKAQALLSAIQLAGDLARTAALSPHAPAGQLPRSSPLPPSLTLPRKGGGNWPPPPLRGGNWPHPRKGGGGVFLIDNYDSFTFNLFQHLSELGAEVLVRRNDRFTLDEVEALDPEAIVISPGPRRPSDAGLTPRVIERFAGRYPILGVCLGHQAIGEVFGGRIVGAPSLFHGKVSEILHDGEGIFAGLPNPFTATRYHSLVVDPASVPASLEVTARTRDGVIMGLRHRELAVEGVQFHPESALTPEGKALLKNFLAGVARRGNVTLSGAKGP